MNEIEETLVYDALAQITRHSPVLCELINRAGGDKQKEAYKGGVYGPAIKLQCVLGKDALERGRIRYEKLAADCAAFCAAHHAPSVTPAAPLPAPLASGDIPPEALPGEYVLDSPTTKETENGNRRAS